MDQICSDGQRFLLNVVLNRIIPAESALPGAGALGLIQSGESAAAKYPAMISLFNRGLRVIEITGGQASGTRFDDLAAEEQDESLNSVESTDPEFFLELVRRTYNGYYTNSRVFEVIGCAPRDAAPGEALELLDQSLLENNGNGRLSEKGLRCLEKN